MRSNSVASRQVGRPVDHQAQRTARTVIADIDHRAGKVRIRHGWHGDQELMPQFHRVARHGGDCKRPTPRPCCKASAIACVQPRTAAASPSGPTASPCRHRETRRRWMPSKAPSSAAGAGKLRACLSERLQGASLQARPRPEQHRAPRRGAFVRATFFAPQLERRPARARSSSCTRRGQRACYAAASPRRSASPA